MRDTIQRRRDFALHSNQKGAALITCLFGLMLVTVLGMSLMAMSDVSLVISTNDRENTEALYVADSGIAHARRLISGLNATNYNAVLTAGDGIPNTGDELSTNLFTTPIPADGQAYGSGSYRVWVTDDNDEAVTQNLSVDTNKRVLVRSVGTGRNGSTATIEAVLATSVSPAMIVNGNLNISGNPVLRGSGGSVHTNAILDLDGDPCADGYFSASGSIIDPSKAKSGGSCSDAGDTRPSQSPVTVPTWDIPTDFKHRATYVMGIDGKVRNSSGVVIDDATSDGKWEMAGGGEWSWDSGGKRWTLGGNTILDGTFYSEGNISISGNVGSSGSPKLVTLIAEGYIEISGNPYLRPHLESYSVMAGTDLKMNGNAGSGTANSQGIHYAGHQVDFSGNPGINGQVIARNLDDTVSPGGTNLVQLSSGFMKVSGNPTITYNGGLAGDAVVLAGWREIRN
jgi:hypothetical protein